MRVNRFSLNRKLKVYTSIIMVPVVLLCGMMLIMMNNYGKRYDAIVRNITAANQYNLSFKEDIDYSMYRIVIGSADPVNLDDNPDIKNPYKVIDDSREVFLALQQVSDSSDERQLNRLMQNMSTLEMRIDEIISNVARGGQYDDNMYKLETNIYILTELIQENIQIYIYQQANTLEVLRDSIEKQLQMTILICIVVVVAILVGMWILTRKISDSITVPIMNLCKTTERVAKGDFSTRAANSTGDEVEKLADSFNRMIRKIGKLVEDVELKQLKLRSAELKVLQAQINPHFLYNTLDTIVWLAEDGKNQDVVQMVSSLSDFFRGVLREGRDTVSLGEEKQHILSYLNIQKYRYSDILLFEINIPDELRNYQILKLTLQPLVENALYHGIKAKRGLGMIRVSAQTKNNLLLLQVSDDGVGMSKAQLDIVNKMINEERQSVSETSENLGFGVYNVAERIRLNYGSDFGLSVDSVLGEGTVFTVRLPLIE